MKCSIIDTPIKDNFFLVIICSEIDDNYSITTLEISRYIFYFCILLRIFNWLMMKKKKKTSSAKLSIGGREKKEMNYSFN